MHVQGEKQCVILAANCPQDYVDDSTAKHPEVTMHRTMLVNRDLGVASGKPFSISTITVIDAGESDLLTLSGNISELKTASSSRAVGLNLVAVLRRLASALMQAHRRLRNQV